MSNENANVVVREREMIDQSGMKIKRFNPQYLLAAINPRSLAELEYEVLLPQITEEHGVIHTPLHVWKINADSPLWETLPLRDTMTGGRIAPPEIGERDKYRILIQGHRRERCAKEVAAHPDRYSKVICDNLATVPCIEYDNISENRARSLALDEEGKRNLKSWEIVQLVIDKFYRDERYQEISLEYPQMLYRTLLKNGDDKYEAVARIHDGVERNALIVKDLRNKLDTWIRSAYLAGPAMCEQLVLYFRYKINQRPDMGDKCRLLLDLKYENMRDAVRKVYNSSKDNGFVPVSQIEFTKDEPPAGENVLKQRVDDGWFVIVGGNQELRESIMKLMREFRNPEEKVKPAAVPSKTERDDVKLASRSGPGKAYSLYFCGEGGEIDGRTRSEWDTWALGYQEREPRILAIKPELVPEIAAIADAVVNERNLEKLEAAFRGASLKIKLVDKVEADAKAAIAEAQKEVAVLKEQMAALRLQVEAAGKVEQLVDNGGTKSPAKSKK